MSYAPCDCSLLKRWEQEAWGHCSFRCSEGEVLGPSCARETERLKSISDLFNNNRLFARYSTLTAFCLVNFNDFVRVLDGEHERIAFVVVYSPPPSTIGHKSTNHIHFGVAGSAKAVVEWCTDRGQFQTTTLVCLRPITIAAPK